MDHVGVRPGSRISWSIMEREMAAAGGEVSDGCCKKPRMHMRQCRRRTDCCTTRTLSQLKLHAWHPRVRTRSLVLFMSMHCLWILCGCRARELQQSTQHGLPEAQREASGWICRLRWSGMRVTRSQSRHHTIWCGIGGGGDWIGQAVAGGW